MGSHVEGRGRCVQVLAESQSIKHEKNFGGGGKSAGMKMCRAASEAVMKLICKKKKKKKKFRTDIFIRIFQRGLLKDLATLRQSRTIFFCSPLCESSWIFGLSSQRKICAVLCGHKHREGSSDGTCNSEPRSQAANTGQRKTCITP